MKIRLLAAALALAALPALANDRVDARQARQQERIDKGVASGQLNQREAKRMDRQQDRIQTAEDKAKADGVVTRKEAAGIERMQDNTSARIARQKHDRQSAKP